MNTPSPGTHTEKVVTGLGWEQSHLMWARPHMRWRICLLRLTPNLDSPLPETQALGWVGARLEIPVGKSYHPHPGELQSSGCRGDERVDGLRWSLAGGSDKAGSPS